MYGKKVKLRAIFILSIFFSLILIVFLVFKSLEENVVYFKSPTEIKNLTELTSKKIRVGGMVKEKSINVNQLVQDSLSQKNISENTNDNVLSYPLKEAREKFEKNYLASQLKKHKGNISRTADFVGMERSALHRKLKSLGIKGIN